MFKVFGLANDSIVDGPGLRFSVFVQGCHHNCKGCHNPESHDPSGGYEVEAEMILEQIKANPLLDGVTLSGGEPFEQAKELVALAKGCKDLGLHVMAYSGFTFEQLMARDDARELLKYVDTLVDGPFVLSQRSLELKFKGSKNQRIIDVQTSLAKGEVVQQVFEDLDSEYPPVDIHTFG